MTMDYMHVDTNPQTGSYEYHENTAKYLEHIRLGRTPHLQEVDGKIELHIDGHWQAFVLHGNVEVANELLEAMSYYYRRLSALFGDPGSKANRARYDTIMKAEDALFIAHPTDPQKTLT